MRRERQPPKSVVPVLFTSTARATPLQLYDTSGPVRYALRSSSSPSSRPATPPAAATSSVHSAALRASAPCSSSHAVSQFVTSSAAVRSAAILLPGRPVSSPVLDITRRPTEVLVSLASRTLLFLPWQLSTTSSNSITFFNSISSLRSSS